MYLKMITEIYTKTGEEAGEAGPQRTTPQVG